MKTIFITLFIILVLVLANLFNNVYPTLKVYHFQTKDGNFEFILIPSKGRDEKMMTNAFIKWRTESQEHSNKKLYRTFKKNYFKIWKWYEYTKHIYYYEYLDVKSK